MANEKKDIWAVNREHVRGYTAEFSKFSKECKNMAKARRARSPIQVELIEHYIDLMDEYEESRRSVGKPMTLSGCCMALGISNSIFSKCLNGEYDHIVDEYMAINELDEPFWVDADGNLHEIYEPSKVFEYFALKIQNQLEENIYTNKGNPAGSIFGLKARYGWKEDEPKTVNQNLVIADADRAKEIMKMLE